MASESQLIYALVKIAKYQRGGVCESGKPTGDRDEMIGIARQVLDEQKVSWRGDDPPIDTAKPAISMFERLVLEALWVIMHAVTNARARHKSNPIKAWQANVRKLVE